MTESVDTLVVVDVQREYVAGPHPVEDAAGLVERLTRLLARARDAGAHVVHIQDDGQGNGPKPNTDGWQLVLPPAPGEHVVRKLSNDAFEDTELADVLADAGARRLVVTGLQSEMCVSATVRGALSRGYEVVLPHDGHATFPVPAAPGISDEVPAASVSRVAEWSFGDEVEVVVHADEVRFTPEALD